MSFIVELVSVLMNTGPSAAVGGASCLTSPVTGSEEPQLIDARLTTVLLIRLQKDGTFQKYSRNV